MKSPKGWRDSASVILVAKTVFSKPKDSFNYKTLTLKRSAKSRFMPGTHVYPGGNCSKIDSSQDWLSLFTTFGVNKESLNGLKFFTHRITAIRETFEETGILICRSFKVNYGVISTPWASFIGGTEIKKWQDKVHDDPNQFINLCSEFEVYPDVWALKEWSNWLTPPSFPSRFNTLFFLAAFQESPEVQAEKSEVQHLEWNTPLDLLIKNRNEELILPPPQFYETSRLLNFKDIDDLANFAHNRPKDLEQIFPHRVSTDDGTYSIYPGDELYPNEIDTSYTDYHVVEKLPETQIQHRTLHKTFFNNQIIVNNFKPKFGHILPLDFNTSKL